MREAVLHPTRQGIALAADQRGTQRQRDHQPKKQKAAVAKAAVVLRMRKRPSRTWQKDPHRHQDGKGPDVKNALDRPYCDLGRNRQPLPPGDEIRPNELSRPSQQRQASESDKRRGHQLQPGCLRTHRPQKKLPTDRPKDISDIDETDGVNDMPRPDLLSLSPKGSPVEASPVTELEINQQTENSENSASDQNASSIHVRGGPEPPSTTLDPR